MQEQQEQKDLISIGEAASVLGVSIDTLRRWDKSGKLSSIKSTGGHRLYSKTQIEFYLNNLVELAKEWAFEGSGEIPSKFYCPNSSVFQAKLSTMQYAISANPKLNHISSLIGAVAGEIGINSFDHNLGNWPDVPGIFFGYDADKGVIVLADRGQGVLFTLKRVRPELETNEEALRMAFSEIVSGRAPENRGNGLKFVREVVRKNPMGLIFQSGDAILTLVKDGDNLKINNSPNNLRGCFALITF